MNKKLILITHGELGTVLINTANRIIGNIPEGTVSAVSNDGLSLDGLVTKIEQLTDGTDSCCYILATDFPGGSCFIAAKKVSARHRNITTVSGVNISMVLSFVTKKEMYDLTGLNEVIKTDGTRAIVT